jgi:hypothetical protein
MVDAPAGAEYSIYVDTNKDYVYDDNDTYICTFKCNDNGDCTVTGLPVGDYVAVLQTDYSNTDIITNNEYAFTIDGVNVATQKSYNVNERLDPNYVANNTPSSTSSSAIGETITINYDMPHYLQNDANAVWTYQGINGSNETMYNYGCLITCFAMVRSYETGTDVTPSEMMKSYSSSSNVGVVFSNSGSSAMAVPSSAKNYGWTLYGSTGYYGGNGEIANNQENTDALLQVLYDHLQDAPVIFGGYSTADRRGSTNHWIVVRGYVGDGETLSAEDFIIYDPSSNNRITLADYQSKYKYWDRLIFTGSTSTTTTTTTTTTTQVANDTPSEIVLGDLNDDQSVNLADLLIMKKYTLDIFPSNEDALLRGDFDRDGELVSNDLVTLKQYLM